MNRIARVVLAAALVTAAPARSQQESAPSTPRVPASVKMPDDLPGVSALEGQIVFGRSCTSCHGTKASESQRAPSLEALQKLSPEAVYAALTTGLMTAQSQHLSDAQKRSVAEYLGGRPLGSGEFGDAKNMPNHCADSPALARFANTPSWNGWGAGPANTRFQPVAQAGLSAAQVPRLKLKWAFGFPGSASMWSQPTIVAGHVFIASDAGYIYSLNAASGCVYWSYRAKASVRTTLSVGPVHVRGSARYALYFGDGRANVYAVDASTGNQLWVVSVDPNPMAQVTGAPTLIAGRVYVPISNREETISSNVDYPCCTARGSVVALDANTGRQLWKTYAIQEEPKPTRKNWNGVQLYAPAGASVWDAPTVDLKGRAVYVGTGDGYTEPAPDTTDAILSLDLTTGKIRWSFQGTENDVWMPDCGPDNKTIACPEGVMGPDWDFGASPILQTLPNGRRILVAAEKSGVVFAFDPDRKGALLWKTNLARKRPDPRGLIVFGGAADQQNAYFALTEGGIAAIGLQDGKRKWFTPIIAPEAIGADAGQSAALTAIPGAAFVGGWDGKLHALSTTDGHILWEFDTMREFTTVNGVKAKGGSMGGPGVVVAGGMVYVGSGYAVFGTGPGNVLLAFGVD